MTMPPNAHFDCERDSMIAPAFSHLWNLANDEGKVRLERAYHEAWLAGQHAGSSNTASEFRLIYEQKLALAWPPEGAPSIVDQGTPELDEARICKVRLADKWIEFWIGNEGFEALKGRFTHCCKRYMLDAVVDREELWDHVTSYGLVGMIVTWPADSDKPTGLRTAKYR